MTEQQSSEGPRRPREPAGESLRSAPRIDKAVATERDFLVKVLEAADAFILVLDDQGVILHVNRAVTVATGYEEGALQGLDFVAALPIREAREIAADGIRCLRAGAAVVQFESHWVASDGKRLLANGSLTALRDAQGLLEHVVVTAGDVTQSRATEVELRAASLHDDLTGLYNRRGFALLADQRLIESRRSSAPVALAFFDIDGLKAINDTFGHNAGDISIALAAKALTASFRESDIVARIGGDEFAVVTDMKSRDTDLLRVRLETEIARLVAESGLRFDVALAMGMSYSRPPHTVRLDELLRQADESMYEQKHRSA